jgi:hypothetical protein
MEKKRSRSDKLCSCFVLANSSVGVTLHPLYSITHVLGLINRFVLSDNTLMNGATYIEQVLNEKVDNISTTV